jgi:16S rRNA (cytosine1402-N4)-methyltransferase
VPERPTDERPAHQRRPRYSGRNPRAFRDKYKELNPERYPEDVQKVLASGKTPAGMHVPIMVAEVLECLRPHAGEVAVDCTLGGGGHARAILERVRPGGRVIGLDVDPIELPLTEARLRAAGFGPDEFVAHHANFASLPKALAAEGLERADLILVDLGVSSMQFDAPGRGFSFQRDEPLDMRMDQSAGDKTRGFVAIAWLIRGTSTVATRPSNRTGSPGCCSSHSSARRSVTAISTLRGCDTAPVRTRHRSALASPPLEC